MQWGKHTALRNIAVFAAVILACLFAPSAVRNFTSSAFEEFRAPLDSIPSHLSDLQKYWSLHSNSKRELIEAGRDLARLNSAYELKLMENESLHRRLERLERIMNMPSDPKFKYEIARVVRRDVNAWWQRLVIRKGSLHGIKDGCAVVCASGVVGRIAEVRLHTSVVELASSRRFRMAARFAGDDRPVIYYGRGGTSLHIAEGEVVDAPADVEPTREKPALLVTSSLAGTFPDGVEIGKVFSLSIGADGIFKSGRVVLSTRLDSIAEVAVLIPVSEGAK